MTTPPRLDELRDVLAETYWDDARSGAVLPHATTIYKAGFDACLKALAETAGEFDEKAVWPVIKPLMERVAHLDADEQGDFQRDLEEIARWQWNQLKLRVAATEEQNQRLRETSKLNALNELRDKYAELEAQCARYKSALEWIAEGGCTDVECWDKARKALGHGGGE